MIYELQHKYPLQNLINKTRLESTTSKELCAIHTQFGSMLGNEILGKQDKIHQSHILNTKKPEKLAFYNTDNFAIISILRAGLYIGLGLREVFDDAMFFTIKETKEINDNLRSKKIIVVDSVINTGDTIRAFLTYFQAHSVQNITIATNVIYSQTARVILQEYQDIDIFCIRQSENSYKGMGGYDTGNRLFGIF